VATPSDPEVVADRYRLVRCLGHGARCEVHEAIDLALGSTVALKRFRAPSLDAVTRIKAEFRALAGIHAPGLVRFFDLTVDGGVAFFTMELVRGVSLDDYARGAGGEALRGVLGRVAAAVGELHARGVLHRDLKPANVLVTRDGDVRVVDFGLAALAAGSAGTLAYTAPELFDGLPPSPASDWYSFGAMLYELLTGRVPASGRDVAEILLRKKLRRFPAVRELAPVAGELGDLAWRLLDPDPGRRPGRRVIAAALAGEPAGDAIADRARVELLGRDAELARLAGALARALDGRPAVVVVEGESGIGKSSLVRAFLAERAAGCCVFRSAARPHESVPLRAIDALVDDLAAAIAQLPDGDRAAVAGGVPCALVRAFPVLGALVPAGDAGEPPGDGMEARRAAQLGLAAVLRRLSGIRPVVLWIDDLQWADHDSLGFLEAAIAGAGAARLCVVLGRRPTALAWPEREAWLAGFDRIALGPLDGAAARALIASCAAPCALTDAAIARALHEGRGNPFLLEFLARHALRDRSGAATFEVGSALRAALAGLAPDARVLFECLALTHHPVPLGSLGRVLADRSELRGHTAQLVAEGLISLDEHDRARPYHDALGERARAALDAATRRSRHASLAVALGDAGAPIEWQIPHLEGSGQLDAAARASITAGHAAAARYAFEIAAACFARALELAALEPPTRARVLEALADSLAAAGDGRAAAQWYDRAAALLEAAEPRAALAIRHKAAIALLRAGEAEAGRAALAAALRGLGERVPHRPVLACGYEAARLAIAPGSPARAQLAPNDELRLDALWTSATALSTHDPFAAHALTLRLVRRARAAGPHWRVRALALHAALLAALGGRLRARAERAMAELRDLASAIEPAPEHAWLAIAEAQAAWLSGDVRRCHEWTSRARERVRAAPALGAFELGRLDALRLPALALLGDHDAVVRSADDLLALARARGDRFAMLPCLHGHVTLAYLGVDQIARAQGAVDEADEIARCSRSPIPACHQAWSRATIALFCGDADRAHRLLVDAWRPLQRSGALRLEAIAGDLRDLRARCALAAAAADRGHARARRLGDAEAQARWLRASSLASGPALADAIAARLAVVAGKLRDGRERAAAASAELRRLGRVSDGDALARWSTGQALLAIDRMYVA
jgi:hypothetical protein